VQENVKAYLSYLINYLNYTGFRYDMVKGFSAEYTKMYNEYANPQFSVGECWDSSNTIKNWIDGTSKKSAAFDFQFRYTVRNAANNGDWSKLGLQNDGNWPLISSNFNSGIYRQWAVTFVENHDTEKRSNATQDPLRKDTLAANAYLLAMPGTPCVFLKHWQAYKSEIAAMIAARKTAGVTNSSSYLNMANNSGYYVNLVNSKLLVAVGNNVNAYTPNANYIEVLSGYHYRYFFNKNTETAWADKASGEYAFPFSVKLTAVSATSDAQLVYTLDGSTPTASSTKVASGTSISITNACTLTVGLLINGSVSGIITRQFFEKTSDPVVTPTYVEGKVFAYFEKPSNWNSSINVWAWQNGKGGEDYLGVGWPGVGITKLGVTENGNELWQWISTSTIVPDNIIFNDGSNQTSDLKFTNGGYYTSSGLQSVITGIETLRNMDNVEESNSAIYDLQGRRISQPTRPGIYIRNGKKYIK
jgi:alpha-amylase